MPPVKVLCSKCKREFIAPFQPTPGKSLYCFICKIVGADMSKTAYMEALVVALTIQLNLRKKDFRIVKDGARYSISSTGKSSSEVLCNIVWNAKYPDRLTPNSAVAKFENVHVTIKKIIADFIKRQGIEMDEREIPALSYRL